MSEEYLTRNEVEALLAERDQRIAELEEQTSNQQARLAEQAAQIESLQADKADLQARVDDLEAEVADQDAQIESLQGRIEDLQKDTEERQERIDDCEAATTRLDSLLDAVRKRADANVTRIAELQSRELEKGAHLEWDNAGTLRDRLDIDGDRLERFTGDDGTQYVRLPNEADPLDRSGTSALAQADLLPIQQLARMDDDMLANATNTRPDYIAAKVWQKRGRHSPGSIWSSGGPGVKEYIDASDVRVFIKSKLERDDEDLSYDYAKKLAGEALERIEELAKHRVHLLRKTHRKDGLQYKERRLKIDSDAEIPGEMRGRLPGTDGVTG